MQSVAYKDQKNSIFFTDDPLLNAMVISYNITTLLKVVMATAPVIIHCKHLQRNDIDLLFAKKLI